MEYDLRHGKGYEYGEMLSTTPRQTWATTPHTQAHPLGMAVCHAGALSNMKDAFSCLPSSEKQIFPWVVRTVFTGLQNRNDAHAR